MRELSMKPANVAAREYRRKARRDANPENQRVYYWLRSFSVLGCSVKFFKAYLEQRFQPGMSWDNWGAAWEIDRIIPISSFDLSDPNQMRNAFHYSNCRPLPKIENRIKHAK